MSSAPQFNTAQLQAARAKAWHQGGEPMATLEAAREWLANAGLLLFAPRPQHIAAPAPSLVEATLGVANDAPTGAQMDTARSLVARLVSEGNALPLNLLGGPGDLPDFVVSAQVFSFIFTLRGDKLWKQAPSTSGTVKVTPLALAAYELLAERGALTASELASELGREITEAAVLRGLNELWTHLRVIPLLQLGNAPTQWELTSRRFTKAIKAGTNAGQPTALSALVSLYLTQALLATEEEVAAFLSPLAARSRIREVVHGLSAGRQLEPVVLEGKTLLHIPGTLPEFPVIETPVPEAADETAAETPAASPAEEGRIKRFTPSADRKPRSEFKGKPARSFGGDARRSPRPAAGGRDDRERRPFRRDASATPGAKPSFTRPWDEDRKPRREPSEGAGEAPAAKRPYERRERPASGGFAKREGREGFAKRPFVKREGGSDRGPAKRSFGDKPPFRKDRGEGSAERPARFRSDGERKPFVRRDDSGSGDREARPRRTSAASGDRKPAFDRGDRTARKPGGFGAKRPYVRREGGEDRPARPAFGDKPRGDKPGGFGAKRPYVRREGSEDRPARAPFGEKRADKPGGFGAKRPYVRREGGDERPPRSGAGDTRSFEAKRPYVRREGGEDRPARPSFGGKPGGRPGAFGGKRPYTPREGGEGRPPRPTGARPSGARPTGGRPGSARPSGGRPSSARPGGSGSARPKFGSGPARGGFSSRPGGRVPFGGKPGFGKRPAAGPRAPRKPRADAEE